MKKIIYIVIFSFISSSSFSNEKKINCESVLSKLKPNCNFVGSSVKQLKNFSSKHKTIGQTLGIKKSSKTLKQITEENKTIDQTLRNIKEKSKKK